MNIFIVDDNAEYRLLLNEVFRDKGWNTSEASDGNSCLRLLHEQVPDVILSDVMMPHMDGFQLLRTLRSSPFSNVIFVFYTSTYEKAEHREFAMSLGADAYIVKPLNPEEIFSVLHTIMERKGLEGERQITVSEEEFLRKHNVLLSDKLQEKAMELQKEEADHRRDEVELLRLRHRTQETMRPSGAPAVTLAPMQCPFSISDNVYRPIEQIDALCEDIGQRREELDDTGAITLVDQLCMSMRRLRQHIKDLQNYMIIPRSELYAPMRRIQMLMEVLRKDYPHLPSWIFLKISEIEKHLRTFSALVEDLVKLTTVAKAELNRQPLDMTMLLRSLVEELRKTAPGRKADIIIREEMQVNADRKLLRLALEQMLDNAWKFTKDVTPARIEADFRLVEQKRIYFIRDNGTGFKMEDADRLFTAFLKLHPIEHYPGNGIGLAIVKTAICRHGGSVWATGDIGKGASFYFTLGA